jgi:hypothetical protein
MVLEIDDQGEAVFTVIDAQGKKTFQAPEVVEASLQ